MHGPVHAYMTEDHQRLNAHLARSIADPERIDLGAFHDFRVGLLRHIAIEEKVLPPTARRERDGVPLAVDDQLQRDHAALAMLLVPTPTPQLVQIIRSVILLHDPLEESDGGMYDQVDGLLSPKEATSLVERVRAIPDPPVAAYIDTPRVHARIAELLRQAGRAP